MQIIFVCDSFLLVLFQKLDDTIQSALIW